MHCLGEVTVDFGRQLERLRSRGRAACAGGGALRPGREEGGELRRGKELPEPLLLLACRHLHVEHRPRASSCRCLTSAALPEHWRLLVHPGDLNLLTQTYRWIETEARQLAFGMRGERMLASRRDERQLHCPPLVELPHEGERLHVSRTGGRGRRFDQVRARIRQRRQQALRTVDLGDALAPVGLAGRHRLPSMVQRAPQVLHVHAVHNGAESLLELRMRLRAGQCLVVPGLRPPSSLGLGATGLGHVATQRFSRLHIEIFVEIK